MEVFVVHSFAENGFKGNPAGVCFVEQFPPPEKMRKTAAKAGFSETAFVRRSGAEFLIRWWTPETEVSLCGHATLAAARMIERRGLGSGMMFVSTEHRIPVSVEGDLITMDFPADRQTKCAEPEGLAEALGERIIHSGKNSADYLIELADEKAVSRLRPDMDKIRALDCRGVIVTSRAERSGYDFVSRFFAPQVGIDEDPVTGSSHTSLAPYWSEKTGGKKMKGLQLSQRGGVVHTEVCGRIVRIGGRAVFEKKLVLQGL